MSTRHLLAQMAERGALVADDALLHYAAIGTDAGLARPEAYQFAREVHERARREKAIITQLLNGLTETVPSLENYAAAMQKVAESLIDIKTQKLNERRRAGMETSEQVDVLLCKIGAYARTEERLREIEDAVKSVDTISSLSIEEKQRHKEHLMVMAVTGRLPIDGTFRSQWTRSLGTDDELTMISDLRREMRRGAQEFASEGFRRKVGDWLLRSFVLPDGSRWRVEPGLTKDYEVKGSQEGWEFAVAYYSVFLTCLAPGFGGSLIRMLAGLSASIIGRSQEIAASLQLVSEQKNDQMLGEVAATVAETLQRIDLSEQQKLSLVRVVSGLREGGDRLALAALAELMGHGVVALLNAGERTVDVLAKAKIALEKAKQSVESAAGGGPTLPLPEKSTSAMTNQVEVMPPDLPEVDAPPAPPIEIILQQDNLWNQFYSALVNRQGGDLFAELSSSRPGALTNLMMDIVRAHPLNGGVDIRAMAPNSTIYLPNKELMRYIIDQFNLAVTTYPGADVNLVQQLQASPNATEQLHGLLLQRTIGAYPNGIAGQTNSQVATLLHLAQQQLANQ